jgi:hypothetical protein
MLFLQRLVYFQYLQGLVSKNLLALGYKLLKDNIPNTIDSLP